MFRFEVFHDESSLFLLRLGEINTPTDMSNSKFKKFSLLLFQVLFYIFQSRPECTLRCTYVRPLSWHVAAKVNRHALVSFLPRIYSFAIFFFFYDPDRQLTAEPDSLKGKKGKKRVNLLTAAVMYIEYTHHHDNNDIIAPVTWGGDFPAFGNERRRLHGGCITSAFGCAATWASSWNCPFYRDDMRYYVRRPFLFFPDKKNLMEITACTCRNFFGLFFSFPIPSICCWPSTAQPPSCMLHVQHRLTSDDPCRWRDPFFPSSSNSKWKKEANCVSSSSGRLYISLSLGYTNKYKGRDPFLSR